LSDLRITRAKMVLPDQIVYGSLYIEEGRIARIAEGEDPDRIPYSGKTLDAMGQWVLPGLVDLHCDAVEKEVQPRPNTMYPADLALFDLDRKLAGAGITTMFHSLSLGVGLSLRGDHLMTALAKAIREYSRGPCMIRHRLHLRYEISHLKGIGLAEEMIRSGAVHYLSFMDHSPGQGQYRRPGSFEAYVMKNQGVSRDEVADIIQELTERRRRIDRDRLRKLALSAQKLGIPMASHDDDEQADIEQACGLGIRVSEFPLNLDTARYAKNRGLKVCVGAPNIVRGGSHDNNMRAMDAVMDGSADTLCSDYLPQALLSAVFLIADEGIPLYEAVRMVTLAPAQIAEIGGIGAIEPGRLADLVFVERRGRYPFVRRTLVGGRQVYEAALREKAAQIPRHPEFGTR